MLFDDLSGRLDLRRLDLQRELLEVCERERERLTSRETELTMIREKCESLLSEIKSNLEGTMMILNQELQSQFTSFSMNWDIMTSNFNS